MARYKISATKDIADTNVSFPCVTQEEFLKEKHTSLLQEGISANPVRQCTLMPNCFEISRFKTR